MSPRAPLRLLAQDGDDLEIISAALQDAVTRIGDIRWEKEARRLTIAFNRFRWEGQTGLGERVRAGFQLGCVEDVKARNLRGDAKDAVLELLAMTFETTDAPGGRVTFAFADGGDLAAQVECIDAALADLSAPWPAPHKPGHET
ncbi:MAG TPA: DUF2948 family protein [Caulobacteraceae bacterium]|nr:DUF2948 family protein [Caulobacteraceae bacterium]